ncbi:MAG: type II toxin-antitoxin system VapC family toxin [Pirellula sp.]
MSWSLRSTCNESTPGHPCVFWFVDDHPNLSSLERNIIADSDNELLISPASYWEIAIKVSLGKWVLNRPFQELLDIAIVQYGFRIIPILPSHTERLLTMPFDHRDPFDRMLIAQAMVEQIPIVSADVVIDAYAIERKW